MNEILELANNLNIKILNNLIYNDYIAARNNLEKNLDLYNRVKNFRKLQIDNRYDEIKNINIDFNTEKHLSKLYSDLRLSSIVNIFFECESNLIELLDKVNSLLEKNIEIDFFDLN